MKPRNVGSRITLNHHQLSRGGVKSRSKQPTARIFQPLVAYSKTQRLALGCLILFPLSMSLSPRFALDISVGRGVEYRLNELLLLPMVILSLGFLGHSRSLLRSPWHPLLLISGIASAGLVTFAALNNPERSLLVLGYGFRFLVFFLIVIVVAILRGRLSTHVDPWILFSVLIAFGTNCIVVIIQRTQGERAVYFNEFTGVRIEMYGSGLLGEPNPLAAGLFFVFILAVVGALTLSRWIPIWMYLAIASLAFTCMAFILNRSALLGGSAVVLVTLVSYWRNWMSRVAFVSLLVGTIVVLAPFASSYFRFDTFSLLQAAHIRFEIWSTSLQSIAANPILGSGPGLGGEPHQAYLRIFAEYGFVVGLWILTMLIVMLLKPVPSSPESGEHLQTRHVFYVDWSLCFRLFLLGLLVAGLFTDALTPVLPWQLLAFLGGLTWGKWIADQRVSESSLTQRRPSVC